MFESLRSKADLLDGVEAKTRRLRALVKNLGVNVHFTAGFSTTAHYDGKAIRVMHPDYLEKTFDMGAANAELVSLYLLLHETAHAMFSAENVEAWLTWYRKALTPEGYEWEKLYFVIDAIEDAIVDSRMRKVYRGVVDYQKKAWPVMMDKIMKGEGVQNPLMTAVVDISTGEETEMPSALLTEKRDACKEVLLSAIDKNRMVSSTKPSSILEEVREAYRIMYGDPKTSMGEGSSEGEERNEGEGEGDAGESGEASDGADAESDDAGDTGEDGAGERESPDKSGDGERAKDSDADGQQGRDDAPDGENRDSEDTGTDAEDGDDGDTQEVEEVAGDLTGASGGKPQKDIVRMDMSKEYEKCEESYADKDKPTVYKGYDASKFDLVQYEDSTNIKGARLIARQMWKDKPETAPLQIAQGRVDPKKYSYERGHLSDIKNAVLDMSRRLKHIVENERAGYSTKHQSGQFDVKALTRLSTQDTNVFKQKTEQKEGGTAVSILLDASGSMGGSDDDFGKMAFVIAQSLMNNGVKVKLSMHTTTNLRDGAVMLVTLKDWDETSLDALQEYHARSDNRDDVATYLTGMELALRPEEKKLLLVLSDGQPADGTSRNKDGTSNSLGGAAGIRKTNNVVKKLRASGVRTVGVYWSPMSRVHLMKRIADSGGIRFGQLDDLKNIYGDDFMTCCQDEWNSFPSKMVRAVADVFRR